MNEKETHVLVSMTDCPDFGKFLLKTRLIEIAWIRLT